MAGDCDPLEDLLLFSSSSEVDEEALSDLVGSLESQLSAHPEEHKGHDDDGSTTGTPNHHLGNTLPALQVGITTTTLEQQQQHGRHEAALLHRETNCKEDMSSEKFSPSSSSTSSPLEDGSVVSSVAQREAANSSGGSSSPSRRETSITTSTTSGGTTLVSISTAARDPPMVTTTMGSSGPTRHPAPPPPPSRRHPRRRRMSPRRRHHSPPPPRRLPKRSASIGAKSWTGGAVCTRRTRSGGAASAPDLVISPSGATCAGAANSSPVVTTTTTTTSPPPPCINTVSKASVPAGRWSSSGALDRGTPTIALLRLPSHIVASMAQNGHAPPASAALGQRGPHRRKWNFNWANDSAAHTLEPGPTLSPRWALPPAGAGCPPSFPGRNSAADCMVLVRTDLGQLVMVPQQALAQAQAQDSLSPRPATPTTGPSFRLVTPQIGAPPSACHSPPLSPEGPPLPPSFHSQGPRGSGLGGPVASQEMQENVKMCKNFLATLIKLASHNSPLPDTSRNVKGLVQDLLDAKIEPEEFTSRLQSELKSSPQPYLVPFLKKSLPALRLSLLSSQYSIQSPHQGVKPASPPGPPLGPPGPHVGGPAVRGHHPNCVGPAMGHTAAVLGAVRRGRVVGEGWVRRGRVVGEGWVRRGRVVEEGWVRRGRVVGEGWVRRGRVVGEGWVRRERVVGEGWVRRGRVVGEGWVRTGRVVGEGWVRRGKEACLGDLFECPWSSHLGVVEPQAGRSPVGLGPPVSGNQKNKPNDPGGGSFREDDDIDDVASMAGVNLTEESARILATHSELVGTHIRWCKDEVFLHPGLLHQRILQTGEARR
ncbi:hypothetical protein NHX12_005973 [Muraenolepis orangiensis]|uniref:TAFH domain-containing protein n=1 Tax=Muraenolepis orangiensis TaxID=630683 RepID=A0A9Q0DSC2_9TELE|nr:hypothetical protein NHX12_005973 [Muraenolepis orangiensis]